MPKFSHSFALLDSGESYRVYCTDTHIARLDFVGVQTVRVAIYKRDEAENILPTFLINPENGLLLSGRDRLSTDGFEMAEPEVQSGEENTIILNEKYSIKIDKNNFLLSFFENGRKLFGDRTPLSYNLDGEFGKGSFHYLSREEGEKIFGLGDKTGDINKSGRSFKIEATDCMGFDASSSDPLYKHVPFFICKNSVGTYGILYDTSDSSYFDFGREINNYYGPYKYFSTEDNCLVYYVFLGSMTDILKQLNTVCGRQAFPPKWSFDYCASTMAYTDAENSAELMDGFLEKLAKLDFSCGGFYLSSGYTSIGAQRYVFNWNREKFPSPERFVKDFEDRGIHIIPNIKPAFLNTHPMYEELAKKGLFVKSEDGSPFLTQFCDGLGSYLDFTNPEAFCFWKNQVKEKLLDLGMIATWNDNNEFDIKDTSAKAMGFGNGEVNASRIRNTLTYLMAASSYTAQTEKAPSKRPFLSSRCSTLAIRRLAQTWSGDNRTEFKDLRYCSKIGLTLSLSGLGFYGHDLGGFTGDMPSRELLLRWLQLGVFQPRFTIHSWNKDGSATMPWSYEDKTDSVRALFAQRKKLLPYMYNCAYKSHKDGLPINAPLFLYYLDGETECDCFMFGRDIIVAPVFDEGETKAQLVLPKGDGWYFGGSYYDGGQVLSYELPADSQVPFAVRAGSVIPYDEAQYGFDSDTDIAFTVYPLKSGEFEAEYFDDDGEGYGYLDGECTQIKFNVSCTEGEITVSYQNLANIKTEPVLRLCEGETRKLNTIAQQ